MSVYEQPREEPFLTLSGHNICFLISRAVLDSTGISLGEEISIVNTDGRFWRCLLRTMTCQGLQPEEDELNSMEAQGNLQGQWQA